MLFFWEIEDELLNGFKTFKEPILLITFVIKK